MRDRILGIVVAAIIVAIIVTIYNACHGPPPVAGLYHDEKSCVAEGGTVHEHEQFGGKYNKSTWWCTDSDGNITGLWFED